MSGPDDRLARVAAQLRAAGATVPAPAPEGTIESAMRTGLSIALVLVEDAAGDGNARQFAPTAPAPGVEIDDAEAARLRREWQDLYDGKMPEVCKEYAESMVRLGFSPPVIVPVTQSAPIDGQHEAATQYAGADTLPSMSWLDERAAQLATGKPPRPRYPHLDPLDQSAIDDEETYAPERGAAIAIQLTVLITIAALAALVWVHRHG